MIAFLLFALVFTCIGSIFYPSWRKLAASLFWTAIAFFGGFWLLFELVTK